MLARIISALKAIAIGMGQIMLQKSPWTGLLFLLGIALNSTPMLEGALIGVISSTITARLLAFDQQDIADGLYGFNGALVGIATFFFLQMQPVTILLAVIGAALSSVMMRGFLRAGIAAYTAPFIITTWALLLAAHFLSLVPISSAPANQANLDIIAGVIEGLGQVMFQGSIITGIAFLVGIWCNSWKDALWAVSGCIVGLIVAVVAGYPTKAISEGLFGYNAALCGIALAGKNPAYPLLAIIASVFLSKAFGVTGIPALTAPFVLATWGALAAARLCTRAKTGTTSD